VAEDTRTGLVEQLAAHAKRLREGQLAYWFDDLDMQLETHWLTCDNDDHDGCRMRQLLAAVEEAAAALASAEEREKALTADRDEARQGLAQQIDLLHAAVADAEEARAERDRVTLDAIHDQGKRAHGANWHFCDFCEYEWREDTAGDECPICALIDGHVKAQQALQAEVSRLQTALQLARRERVLAVNEQLAEGRQEGR
jgi:rubrerythrin